MPILIAEVKTQSPFGFRSEHSFEELLDVACEVGDWVAVHTDPRWGGSLDLIRLARERLVAKGRPHVPILAKGRHDLDYHIVQARDYGADHVLIVGRMPAWKYLPHIIFETQTLYELKYFRNLKVCWNQRNLVTGLPKTETFAEARAIYDGWLCQASYIRTPDDIDPRADAVLVGEHLMEFAEHWKAKGKSDV